ncbi:MAG: hypothetical protein KDM81_18755, partial [Verrucomicrobiae bacterium]|nr:hypothetical protein [Verrucomicrobiae bacterium]
FRFQWHDGTGWRDVPHGTVADNESPAWCGRFGPVNTRRLRLGITATQDGISRIWEIEVYAPATASGIE